MLIRIDYYCVVTQNFHTPTPLPRERGIIKNQIILKSIGISEGQGMGGRSERNPHCGGGMDILSIHGYNDV